MNLRKNLDTTPFLSIFSPFGGQSVGKTCLTVGKPILVSAKRHFLIIEKDSCTNSYSCLYCIGLLSPCKVRPLQKCSPERPAPS